MAAARIPVARACLAAVLLQSAWAQLRVMSPEGLMTQFADGRIDGSTATFGAPFYGERVLGKLVYGQSYGNRSAPHCREQEYDIPKTDDTQGKTHEKTTQKLINIAVVRRGGCSFVTKVKIAQAKGAHAVVIVDKEGSSLTSTDIRRIIVADDGYGSTITIPSLLISNAEGQSLIGASGPGLEPVIVELAWDVPTDHVVRMDLWMSSASRESSNFLKQFATKRRALNNAMKFQPHYAIFGMKTESGFNDMCEDGKDQFCAEDPDGPGPVTGAMVVDEDVRQICIHRLHRDKPKADSQIDTTKAKHAIVYSKRYWDYVEIFLDECPLDGTEADKRFGKECSERVMKKVGIDSGMVAYCASGSRQKILSRHRAGTAWSPRAVRINGWRYSGTFDVDLVTRAICAGFVKQPAGCRSLPEPVRPGSVAGSSVGIGTFATAILVVVALALSALLLYRRSMTKHIHSALREEVMLEVQAQMESYNQLAAS